MNTPSSSTGTVAYILKMFPRFSETFILSEILELERNGMDVQIYSLKTPNDGRVHADVARVQAPVTCVEAATWRQVVSLLKPHLEVLRWNPRRYLKVAMRAVKRKRWGAVKRFVQAGAIAPSLKAGGVTHVHAHFASSATSVAWYLNQLMDMPYSFTAHAKDIYLDSVSQDVLSRKMNDAQFVVTVSEYNLAHLHTVAPEADVRRIYNGLDLTQFVPNGVPPDETPLVLAVGRLVEKKGFDDLIRAAAVLKAQGLTFRCQIVGTGSELPVLQQLVSRLEVEDVVTLSGPLPREELIRLYPTASVFVAPCVIGEDGNRDGLPTVLIEAMALQVPVISTPVTGIPELVREGETGRLVAPNAPDDLAEAIGAVLRDRERAHAMAKQGRMLVEHQFDLRRNVADLRSLFQKAS